MIMDRRFMLIDDELEEMKGLIRFAGRKMNVEITGYSTWEEAQAELDSNFDYYDALIIDGKGQIDSDSESEDDAHIQEAIGWLKEEAGKGRRIPYVMYTAFHANFKSLRRQVEIFDKNEQGVQERLLNHLIEQTRNKPRIKFPDVYEVFELGFLSKEDRKDYIKLAEKVLYMNLNDKSFICDVIRKIQENMYKKLIDFLGFEKKEYEKSDGKIDFLKLKTHLSGRLTKEERNAKIEINRENIQGKNIENLSNMIYWVTSANLHRDEKEESIYKVGNNTLLSLFYALNEQLLWYKQIIKS